MPDNTIRINANIPIELHTRWNDAVPFGMRSEVIKKLVEMTVEAVEIHGIKALLAIVEKEYDPTKGPFNANT